MNNVVLPIAALSFLYFSLLTSSQVSQLPIIGTNFLPPFAINSFLAASVVAIGLCFLGFAGAVSESKTALEAYSVVLGTILALMVTFTALIMAKRGNFQEFFDKNWGDLMIHINQDFFTAENMFCYGGKYRALVNSTNFYDLPCSGKRHIAYMWEVDYSKNIGDQ